MGPIQVLQFFYRAFESIVQVIPERHHIVGVDPRDFGARALTLDGFENARNPGFINLVFDPFLVEVLEPGIGENLGDLDFAEQLELYREGVVRAFLCPAAEAGNQSRCLLAPTHRVDVVDEVQGRAAKVGLELTLLVRRQRGNQVRLACLRQTEKTNGHGCQCYATQAFGQVTGAVQAQVQVVCFAVQARSIAARVADPVQRLTGTFMNSGPVRRELGLFRGQVAHLRFTLPLSSQYLVSLRPASSMVLSSSSRSLRGLKVTFLLLDSMPATTSRSLGSPCFLVCLSGGLTAKRTLSSGAAFSSPMALENLSRPAGVKRSVYSGDAAQRSAASCRKPRRRSPRISSCGESASSPVPTSGSSILPSSDTTRSRYSTSASLITLARSITPICLTVEYGLSAEERK